MIVSRLLLAAAMFGSAAFTGCATQSHVPATARSEMVQTTATIIEMTEAQLLSAIDAKPLIRFPGGDETIDLPVEELTLLSPAQARQLLAAASSDTGRIVTAPRLTTLSGQTGNISIQNQITFCAGYDAVKSGAQVIMEPRIGTLNNGLELVVSASTSGIDDQVQVSLRLEAVDTTFKKANLTFDFGAPGTSVEIQVPYTMRAAVKTNGLLKAERTYLIPVGFPTSAEPKDPTRLRFAIFRCELVKPDPYALKVLPFETKENQAAPNQEGAIEDEQEEESPTPGYFRGF